MPAASAAQAMDWSLVLLSQGIECVIVHAPEGWRLRVPAASLSTAQTVLARYEAENRPRPWQRELYGTGLIFDWASVAWALVAIAFFLLADRFPLLRERGFLDGAAVWEGQWWRLLTAIWLHADAAHLAMNLTFGIPLLALAMGGYGSGCGFLAALGAGILGNAAALAVAGPAHRSLGASGMVLGALGLLTALGVWWSRRVHVRPRWAVAALAAGLMLFVLLGAAPESDLLAHGGGFGAGLLLGGVLVPHLTRTRSGALNLLAGWIAATLTILAWYLALR